MLNIRTLCLGILHFGEATGYEINKLASDGNFSHFIEASYGSIYPALTRLTNDGLVTWREEKQAGNPPRKVYAITQAGRAELHASLLETPRDDVFKSEFLFLHLFSGFLSREHLQRLTEKRIADLEAERDRMLHARCDCGHPASKFALGYGIALNSAGIDYLKSTPLPEASPALADGDQPTPLDVPELKAAE
ncbi:MAG: PadR family transcriptional regulator [Pseudomonadota bacterium]